MASDLKTLPDRFPAIAHMAFEKIRGRGDFSEVSVVILAAIHDLLPAQSPEGNRGSFDILTNDKRLIEDLEFDSLAIAELVFFLEDLLAVSVSNTELRQIHTIGELKNFIDQKLRHQGRPPAL
jgi:acyl carrier protein